LALGGTGAFEVGTVEGNMSGWGTSLESPLRIAEVRRRFYEDDDEDQKYEEGFDFDEDDDEDFDEDDDEGFDEDDDEDLEDEDFESDDFEFEEEDEE